MKIYDEILVFRDHGSDPYAFSRRLVAAYHAKFPKAEIEVAVRPSVTPRYNGPTVDGVQSEELRVIRHNEFLASRKSK